MRWDALSDEDKAAYDQITVIIKDKRVKVEGANVRRLKPSEVVAQINDKFNVFRVTTNLHVVLYKLFRIRPGSGADDPFDTNATYCLYDEPHGDYVYQPEWVDFVINYLQVSGAQPTELRKKLRSNDFLDVSEYET